MSYACFAQGISSTFFYHLCRTSDVRAVLTIFNVYSYDAVLRRDLISLPP